MQILASIVIAVIVICVMVYMNKRTAAKLYADLVLDIDKPVSPYGVSREISEGGSWGYCITKDGEVMYSGTKAKVFDSVNAAVREINKLEAVQGFRKTRV